MESRGLKPTSPFGNGRHPSFGAPRLQHGWPRPWSWVRPPRTLALARLLASTMELPLSTHHPPNFILRPWLAVSTWWSSFQASCVAAFGWFWRLATRCLLTRQWKSTTSLRLSHGGSSAACRKSSLASCLKVPFGDVLSDFLATSTSWARICASWQCHNMSITGRHLGH